jgi:hypothetical protein
MNDEVWIILQFAQWNDNLCGVLGYYRFFQIVKGYYKIRSKV